MREQLKDFIWVAFVGSLSKEQQSALADVIDMAGRDGILQNS